MSPENLSFALMENVMEDIVIVAATRTAVSKFGGTLAKTPAPDLGAAVVVELLKRARLSGEQIGEPNLRLEEIVSHRLNARARGLSPSLSPSLPGCGFELGNLPDRARAYLLGLYRLPLI